MKNKILILSILAAILVILLPISPVVGVNVVRSNAEKEDIHSPLFATRVNSVLKRDNKEINTNYVGKGKILDVFLSKKISLEGWIDKAIKIIDGRPQLLHKIINRFYEIPEFVTILKKHGISKYDLDKRIESITSDPSVLRQEIDKAVQILEEQPELQVIEPPEPLSFTGQAGCLLVFLLVLFPLIIMIGTMVSTIVAIIIPGTLIIPTCFQTVFEQIMRALIEGFSQGLTPTGNWDNI